MGRDRTMGRLNRNSCQFDAETIAKKPQWLQRQIAALQATPPPPATTIPPHEPKPANPAQRARKGHPAHRKAQGAIAECPVRQAPLGAHEGETFYSGRVSVRVTSYRRRLLDPDNLCAKWFLDACRYSRLIRDDRPEDITFSVSQEKVTQPEDERTEILIEPSP